MWKNVFDILKAAGVLLLLVAGIMALPFFLVTVVALFVGYVIYAIIHDARINKEKEQNNAQT